MTGIIEHVGNTTGESQHYHQERYQKHQDVLQHDSDAQYDRSEMFRDNPSLDTLQDGESEGNPPEYSARRLHCCNISVRVGLIKAVLQHPDDQADQEEAVGDDVVVVPESEVSLLESPGVRVGLLKAPEERCSADVSEAVGGDEDSQSSVHPVDTAREGLERSD